ncbi:MAG: S8 family serine peptidase [Acetobacter sp.]|nr:S8 family serine peptidase [Bacteroides sp.]MCM1341898.1 S8 family serine peptidase [Acetobacter sp.]MCM1434082.1 S8 family serine peptidase [Clostridiales bacterium]
MKIKKILSIILSIIIILSTVVVGFYAYANDIESKNIENFVDEVADIVSTYDTDKEFVVSSETPEIISQNDDPTIWEPTLFEDDEKPLEENELDFQTCRLIVKQSKRFDDKDAIAVADGFEDYHIVQFENEKDTEEAYNKYLNDKYVSSVSVDEIISVDLSDNQSAINEKITAEDLTDNWYTYSTGIKEFLTRKADILNNSDFFDIKVAVLDTGINYNHQYFTEINTDRLVKTGFNLFSDGDESDDTYGHGTMVASVIAANTPNCVKIATYKVISNSGITSLSYLIEGFIQAKLDGCKIFNCSFGINGLDEKNDEILQFTLKSLYDEDCFICVAAGNYATNMDYGSWRFENSDYVYCIGGNTAYNIPYQKTNYGESVRLLAPATDIPVAEFTGGYKLSAGTSFSAPFISAVYALLDIIYNNMTMAEKERMMVGSTVQHDTPYSTGYFGSGIIDVLKLFDMLEEKAPEINVINSGKNYGTDKNVYVGPVTIELKSDENCDIYYTMGSKYPSPRDSILYTEPIKFSDDYFTIKAIAVNKKTGYRSAFSSKQIHSATLDDEDMFTINNEGVITSYSGNVKYLKIPETINGITVEDIGQYVFSNINCIGVVLPETITELGIKNEHIVENDEFGTFDHYYSYAFSGNPFIQYIISKNLSVIHDFAFEMTNELKEVDFPNVIKITEGAFDGSHIYGMNLPNLKDLDSNVFSHGVKTCTIREFYAENLETFSWSTFTYCKHLSLLDIPNANICKADIKNDYRNNDCREVFSHTQLLKSVTLNNLDNTTNSNYAYSDMFYNCGAKRFELSNAVKIDSLPANYLENIVFNADGSLNYIRYIYGYSYDNYATDFILVLPSTLEYLINPYERYKNNKYKSIEEHTHYVVYGSSKASYAAQWADEVGADFIMLDRDNSIVKDVYPVYDRFSNEQLSFDCYGFNKQYQWYGSYTNDTENGIALDGANSEVFSPENYEYYPYYYCVMTSTDKDNDGNVVKTFDAYSAVSHNLLYSEPEEPATEPTEPSTEVTEPTKPSTENTTESTTVQNTNPVASANETTSEVGTTDNSTTNKQSQNNSTSSQSIKKNNSKISPNTGGKNESIVVFCICIIVFIVIILIKKKVD